MKVNNYWNTIINAGVNQKQTMAFSDKLQARNKLSFLCAVFSLVYVIYFLQNGLLMPFLAISFGIVLFITSIILNRYQKFNVSSFLILFNTNYCVLFFSLYLGFDSGIHLYLFTSPLIVISLFDTKKVIIIAMAMTTYIFNFIILLLVAKLTKPSYLVLSQSEMDFFYLVNFICSSFILITLSLYFLYNNSKVNQLLILQNNQLLNQREQLEEENKIRKNAESQALTSLAEREVLLSEIHHRVNNSLAVVSALLELQTFYITDTTTTQTLKESQNRIKSIALLHKKLYENKSLKNVDIKSYTVELIQFIQQSIYNKDRQIEIHTAIENINIEMGRAMPFGLLLNELITNSYKYAFENRTSGTIWLTMAKINNDYVLTYKDDGPGFEYTKETKEKSLGLNLIESFCTQLNGILDYKIIANEMVFELKFPTLIK